MLVFGKGHLELAHGYRLYNVFVCVANRHNPDPFRRVESDQRRVFTVGLSDCPALTVNRTAATRHCDLAGQKVRVFEQRVFLVVLRTHVAVSAEPGLRVAVCPRLVLGVAAGKNGKLNVAERIVPLGLLAIGANRAEHHGAHRHGAEF